MLLLIGPMVSPSNILFKKFCVVIKINPYKIDGIS